MASPGSACTMANTTIDSKSHTGMSCRIRYIVYFSTSVSFPLNALSTGEGTDTVLCRDIRRANATAAVRKGAHHAGLVALYLPGGCGCHSELVQVEMG